MNFSNFFFLKLASPIVSDPVVQTSRITYYIPSKGAYANDIVASHVQIVAGKVAGGCNLVLFTTGRGSVFGFQPAPTIKVCSNSATYRHMRDDMDYDAGRVLESETGLDAAAAELLDLVVAVALGQRSKSEKQGVGAEEFVPWNPLAVI